MPAGPDHVFGDIRSFLPIQVQKACGMHGGRRNRDNKSLKAMIMGCTPSLTAWCFRHGEYCKLTPCDFHAAGSPCVDASVLGTQTFMAGPCAALFWAWAALVRTLLFKIVLHENVPQFGDQPLRQVLGTLYIVVRLLVSPTDLGWPAKRPRQVCILILRTFLDERFRAASLTESQILGELDFHTAFRALFYKSCGFTFKGFRVSSPSEVELTLAVLAARTAVARNPGSRFCFLTDAEERRVDLYAKTVWVPMVPELLGCGFRDYKTTVGMGALRGNRGWAGGPHDEHHNFQFGGGARSPIQSGTIASVRIPAARGQACDLHHRPPARAVFSKGGSLFCLVKNCNLVFDLELNRPWTSTELLTAMGIPVVKKHCELAGIECAFSEPWTAAHGLPTARTLRSCTAQLGNAMHVSVMGALTTLVLLAFPALGTSREPGRQLGVQLSNASSTDEVRSLDGVAASSSSLGPSAFADVLLSKRRRLF